MAQGTVWTEAKLKEFFRSVGGGKWEIPPTPAIERAVLFLWEKEGYSPYDLRWFARFVPKIKEGLGLNVYETERAAYRLMKYSDQLVDLANSSGADEEV